MKIQALSFVWIVAILAGCSSVQKSESELDRLYEEAEQELKDEHYLVAIDKFREVKTRFPYSDKAVEAELRIADAYFGQESFIEAESAYEIFRELHPSHPKSDYVQYRVALSFFRQMPDVATRDLSAAHQALQAFQTLTTRFPSSSYVAEAKKLIGEIRFRLAEYENYVADFYFRRKHYLSASYRYGTLLKEYPELGFDEEALFRLGECYYRIEMIEDAKRTFDQFLKRFPNSNLNTSARELLDRIRS